MTPRTLDGTFDGITFESVFCSMLEHFSRALFEWNDVKGPRFLLACAFPNRQDMWWMPAARKKVNDRLKRFPALIERLHEIAGALMRRERSEHTLQPTALVNEAYLRLSQHPPDPAGDDAEFVAAAANAMRQILVDHARERNAAKRLDGRKRVAMSDKPSVKRDQGPELSLAIERGIERMRALSPRAAQVVELRFFYGLSVEETAQRLGISAKTVKRDWVFGRAWLRAELKREGSM